MTPRPRRLHPPRSTLRRFLGHVGVPLSLVLSASSVGAARATPTAPAPALTQPHLESVAAALRGKLPTIPGHNVDRMEVEASLTRDFDRDGVPDWALIMIEPLPAGADPYSTPRKRVVLMALTRGDGFGPVQHSTCLSLNTDEGGMMGDPGGAVDAIGKESAVFSNHGGSAWRWSLNFTVAWRHGAFRLVGMDTDTFHTLDPTVDETRLSVNLLTGRFISARSGVAGKSSKSRHHGFAAPRIEDCESIALLQEQRFDDHR